MGLDIGDRRIGVAISDPLGVIAYPLTVIERHTDEAAIAGILGIIREKDIGRIIVGLPVSMDGSLGAQAAKVKEFTAVLAAGTGIPLEFRDERLSTVAARRLMKDFTKKSPERHDDAAAAAVVLQAYLEENAGSDGGMINHPPGGDHG